MKHRKALGRIAAVASSVLLVAGYVSCRVASDKEPPTPTNGEREVLPGSKSGAVFQPTESEAAFMGGSKSARVMSPEELRLYLSAGSIPPVSNTSPAPGGAADPPASTQPPSPVDPASGDPP